MLHKVKNLKVIIIKLSLLGRSPELYSKCMSLWAKASNLVGKEARYRPHTWCL
jgi:hypothetical protein